MPGLPSLGEKRWAHPLPLATIPTGAWHRYTPPCLCAPWHPSHGLICHSLTRAPSTGLAHARQLSGLGQHLSPLPFSHINGVLSIVHDIKLVLMNTHMLKNQESSGTEFQRYGGPQLSRQKVKPHGKQNNLTRHWRNFPVSLFLFAVRFSFWFESFSFCRKVFLFAASLFLFAAPLPHREVFLFAVSLFLFPVRLMLLPWQLWATVLKWD